MANAFVYILFIVAVFFRVLILWWGALRLQPQHEQTWAVREPRLRHFHRRRVNAYLAVLAVALLGFVLLMTQSTQAQLQAQSEWLGLLIILPAYALCALIEIHGYYTTHLLVFKNYTDFYWDWDYYARDDSTITQIMMAVYSLMVVTILLVSLGRAWMLWQ